MQTHQNDLSDHRLIYKLVLAGFVGGVSEIFTYPLDRIKTRCISKQAYISKSFLHFREAQLIYKEIVQQESWTGLFYGLRAGMDRAITGFFTKFFVYDYALGRKYENQHSDQLNNFEKQEILVATLASSILSAVMMQPSNLLKLKYQCEPLGKNQFKLETQKQKQESILKFHNGNQLVFLQSGIKSLMIHQTLSPIIEILTFLKLQQKIQDSIFQRDSFIKITTFQNVISCMLASSFSTFLFYPLEFLNYRYVFRKLQNYDNLNFIHYTNVIIQKEGAFTFFKGIIPAILKNSLQNAFIMFFLQTYIHHSGDQLYFRELERKEESQQMKMDLKKKYLAEQSREIQGLSEFESK